MEQFSFLALLALVLVVDLKDVVADDEAHGDDAERVLGEAGPRRVSSCTSLARRARRSQRADDGTDGQRGERGVRDHGGQPCLS
jgi:hypothetical protein